VTIEQRFWSRVEKTDGCWLWTGGRGSAGYGSLTRNHRRDRIGAHRFAYELLVGPIPKGKQLDHLCRVRHCVNPAHLEPVTIKENVLRGEGITARLSRQTHCKHGHEFTPENTGRQGAGRYCRTCHRASWKRWNEKRKEILA
jgi:hypothetical protein